jgi:hypothetical protein
VTVTQVNVWGSSWGTPDAEVTTPPVNRTLQVGVSSVTAGHWLLAFVALHTIPGIPTTVSVGDDACNNWTPLVTTPLSPPTSLALNTNPSFETGNTTGWAGVNATIAAVTNEAYSGTYSCLITPNGTSAACTLQSAAVVVTSNLFYSGSIWMYSPSGYSGIRPFISWLTTSSVFISVTFGTTTTIAPSLWSQLTLSLQAPSNAGQAVWGVQLLNSPQAWDTVYADLATLTTGNGWSAATRVAIWAAPNVRSGTTTVSMSPLGQVNGVAAIVYEMSGLPNWLTASPVTSGFAATSSTVNLSLTPSQNSLILAGGAGNANRYVIERVRNTWNGNLGISFNNGVDANADLDLLTIWQVASTATTASFYGVFAANTNPIFASSTTGWQVVGGALAYSTSVGLISPFHSALLTPNGTSANVDFSITHASAPAVSSTFTYTASVYATAPNTSAVTAQVGIEWLNASRSSITTVYSGTFTIPGSGASQWYNNVIQAIAPGTARFASVHLKLPGTPPAGHRVNVGEAALTQVTNAISGAAFTHPLTVAGAMAAIELSPPSPSQPSSTWPNLQLEVAFGQAAGTSVDLLSYTNISDRLFAVSTDRGRQYELNALQAANVNFVLRNDDGLLTPGSSAAGAFSVQPYNPFRLYAIWSGRRYNLCVGYVERWPQTWEDAHFGLVPAVGVDSWVMMTPLLQSIVREEILVDQPLLYWPLADPTANSSAANLGFYSDQLPVTTSAFGPASSVATFGASNLSLVGDTGTNWSMSGLKSSSSQAFFGHSLNFTSPTLPPLASSPFNANTIVFWCMLPDTGPITTRFVEIFSMIGSRGPILAIQQLSSGVIQVVTWNATTGASTAVSTGFSFFNKNNYALKVYAGGWSLYIDSVLQLNASNTLDPAWRSMTFCGRSDPYATGAFGNMSFSHIAVFNRPLPVSRLITYYFASTNGMAGDLGDWRVSRYLSYLQWAPPQRIYYDAVNGRLSGATDIDGQDVGTAINNVGQTTQSLQYVDRNGYVTYRTRMAATNRGTQAVFGEKTSLGEIPYRVTLVIDYDPQYISNDIQLTHKGTPPFQVTSSAPATTVATSASTSTTILIRKPASVLRNGDKTLQITSYYSSLQQSIDLGNYLANQYQNPLMRVAQVEITPGSQPAAFATILGLDIGDRVTLNRRPIGANNVISLDVTIIGIHHDIEEKSGKWSYKLDIMPTAIAAIQTRALKLNDSVLGKLDTTNVIGW